LTLISNKAIVNFSVLLSKDLQTGAVGNGRLFPHFFGEAGASGIGHRASAKQGIEYWAFGIAELPSS